MLVCVAVREGVGEPLRLGVAVADGVGLPLRVCVPDGLDEGVGVDAAEPVPDWELVPLELGETATLGVPDPDELCVGVIAPVPLALGVSDPLTLGVAAPLGVGDGDPLCEYVGVKSWLPELLPLGVADALGDPVCERDREGVGACVPVFDGLHTNFWPAIKTLPHTASGCHVAPPSALPNTPTGTPKPANGVRAAPPAPPSSAAAHAAAAELTPRMTTEKFTPCVASTTQLAGRLTETYAGATSSGPGAPKNGDPIKLPDAEGAPVEGSVGKRKAPIGKALPEGSGSARASASVSVRRW